MFTLTPARPCSSASATPASSRASRVCSAAAALVPSAIARSIRPPKSKAEGCDRPVSHSVRLGPMTTLSTSAGTVAYDSHGSGDTIVLLPSGGHEQHDYDEIRELLPEGLRSIGVDWPGHGQSPAGPAAPPAPALAQIVQGLLQLP